MSKKYKKASTILNYTKYCLALVSEITWCVSISAFVSSVGNPLVIASSSIGLKRLCSNCRN